MSEATNSIRKGLEEALAYVTGRVSKKAYRVHVPKRVDVKAIRAKLEA
jgi:putative transcriptional regulator